jgi:glycosyltransferase involved in cell wall biosynthesis
MSRRAASRFRRVASLALLTAVYGAAAALSRLTNRRGTPGPARARRLLVIGTFHNPNWYQAHLLPLTRCGAGEVLLVCDEAPAPMAGVRFACPPAWLSRICSRALAKFLWAAACAIRYRPDLCMGYHIFPAAVSALVVARLVNRPACYQDTSGPLELDGGGWHAENRVLAGLGKPSPFIERLAHAVVREFDLIVVRGTTAADYIRRTGYRRQLAVITGSIAAPAPWAACSDRPIDLIFVGQLIPRKRADRFLAIVAGVAAWRPDLRAVVVGDGADRESLVARRRPDRVPGPAAGSAPAARAGQDFRADLTVGGRLHRHA